tara:strand:+ start:54 stop:746 length:693 start_codon:yes stop_codon:yes gene_type:complete
MSDNFLTEHDPALVFPTVIKKYTFPKPEELKECLFEIINKMHESGDYNDHHSKTLSFFNNKSGCSLFKNESKNYEIVKEFQDFAETCAKHYCTEVLNHIIDGKMICTNSWVNYYSECDSYQQEHIHVNSLVSSNYFANFDKEVHSPLIFKHVEDYGVSTFLHQEWRKELGEHSIWDTASIDCNEGDILFWRSHKFHFVPVSRKPGRLSLSCNYVPELVELGGYGFRVSPA